MAMEDDRLADGRLNDAAFEFEPARFVAELGLPVGSKRDVYDAAKAVHQEYRDCSRWKQLSCHRVSIFAERDRGTVYVIHVGATVEFDWTWEGAKAFCPKSVGAAGLSQSLGERIEYDGETLWSGEILEVDERNGCLFVSLDHPEMQPTVGTFLVKPFEFLSVLEAVYNGDPFLELREELGRRLTASAGDMHPTVGKPRQVGIGELREWWQHSWSVLWGPPGTGKTYTTGQQIAQVLADPEERILVVSTTNRATDAVALSVGVAAQKHCPDLLDSDMLMRIGKGASYQTFVDRGLESMLRDTESETLAEIDGLAQQLPLFDSWEEKALTRKRIGELRTSVSDQSQRIFIDPGNRVVVGTVFKAMSYLDDETIRKMVENGEAPFTTIFIDEAGLISRTAIAALSLLAAHRVVLVGDSKQLAPISRISRILPTREQKWLASSGLSHLDEIAETHRAVHVLSEQRRMHPDVCQVVSQYQYDGFLTTATDRVETTSNLAKSIADYARAIWYVLDEEDVGLESIRAGRGPGNKSWVRDITPAILEKLFSDEEVRSSTGMFISPYKAQAQVVGSLLAKWGVESWEASTVHSQQGSEADIVVFDTVNAGSYNWPFDEWKRLVNVALSRAREAVIVLASRNEMEEPYLRPLISHLRAAVLGGQSGNWQWQDILATSLRNTDTRNTDTTSGGTTSGDTTSGDITRLQKMSHDSHPQDRKSQGKIGDQFRERKEMKPVLSQEQQRLANLELDGKPRLVRGVAGSGKSVVLCNWLAKTAKRLESKRDARIWAVYANRSLHKLLQESVEAAWANLTDGDLFDRTGFPWKKVSLLHVKDVLAGMLPSADLSMDLFGYDYDRAAEEFLNRQDSGDLLPRCAALFIDEAQDMGPSTLKLLLSVVEQSDEADPNSRSAHVFYDNAQNVYGTKTPKWSEFGLDMRGRSTILRESYRSTIPITELAVNVLHRLSEPNERLDQQELLSLGLLERTSRNGEEWFHVRFNETDGPKPIYNVYGNRTAEIEGMAAHMRHMIEQENISPQDICLIYNGKARQILESQLRPSLDAIGVELSVQTNRPYQRKANTLVATTPHSFKGYESEVVLMPCVDYFVASEGKILANSVYVAMTRARSLLAIYGIEGGSAAARRLNATIAACVDSLNSPPSIDVTSS